MHFLSKNKDKEMIDIVIKSLNKSDIDILCN